ncbi:MAG: radical SAM protein, partial [Desulfovibrionales bacterium]
MGEPAFRARQLWQWVWQKGVFDFEAMTDMSKPFRARLKRKFEITLPTVTDTQIASDGTVKLLLALADGRLVETVLIPEEDRLTQCLSTQVGCPLRCSFCSTGAMGLERNLTSGEILGQVLAGRQHLARTETGKQIKNLVFMGMGEPLLNWDNVHAALLTLNHPLGLDFSTR